MSSLSIYILAHLFNLFCFLSILMYLNCILTIDHILENNLLYFPIFPFFVIVCLTLPWTHKRKWSRGKIQHTHRLVNFIRRAHYKQCQVMGIQQDIGIEKQNKTNIYNYWSSENSISQNLLFVSIFIVCNNKFWVRGFNVTIINKKYNRGIKWMFL